MNQLQVTLLALYGATALNWSLHWYTHVVTYRLFGVIAEVAPGEAFVRYHQAYEKRLVWSIYLPWSLLVALSVAYCFVAPSGVSAALVFLNASIAAISLLAAVPVHRRVDQLLQFTAADHAKLMQANLARLLAASSSLALVLLELSKQIG